MLRDCVREQRERMCTSEVYLASEMATLREHVRRRPHLLRQSVAGAQRPPTRPRGGWHDRPVLAMATHHAASDSAASLCGPTVQLEASDGSLHDATGVHQSRCEARSAPRVAPDAK